MTLGAARNYLLVGMLCLYVLFDYGFMLIRIPPVAGGGVPLAELALAFVLATLNYRTLVPRLAAAVPLLPLCLWWTFGLARALMGVPEHGLWALRDATHVIESLFLLGGFALGATMLWRERTFRWLLLACAVAAFKGLVLFAVPAVAAFSPTVASASGDPIPLLTSTIFAMTATLLTATWLLLSPPGRRRGLPSLAVGTGLIAYAVLFSQSRTVYLQVGMIFLLLGLVGGASRRRALGVPVALALALVALTWSGVSFKGRLGGSVGGAFVVEHALTMVGASSEETAGAASGVAMRLVWWARIAEQLGSSAPTALFGLGFGMPLVDFVESRGVPVREPHNSYISVVARMGLLGLLFWSWAHLGLLLAWWRAFRASESATDGLGRPFLILFAAFVGMVWLICLGEDGLEKPFLAVPYYLLWGLIVRASPSSPHRCPPPEGEGGEGVSLLDYPDQTPESGRGAHPS